jgi:hypothetical protein
MIDAEWKLLSLIRIENHRYDITVKNKYGICLSSICNISPQEISEAVGSVKTIDFESEKFNGELAHGRIDIKALCKMIAEFDERFTS